MEITIRGNNYTISESMEDFATKKLSRLNRYLPNISDIHVDLTKQDSRRGEDKMIAQITVRHARGAILRAEESAGGDNMQTALNLALDNMYRRIERFKGKRSRKGKMRFSMTLEERELAETLPDFEDEEAETDSAELEPDFSYEAEELLETDPMEEIIRRKSVQLIAMNEAEAIEQLELLGHSFFMFFNETTGGVNVIYKRRDGGYGVLVPAG